MTLYRKHCLWIKFSSKCFDSSKMVLHGDEEVMAPFTKAFAPEGNHVIDEGASHHGVISHPNCNVIVLTPTAVV